MERNISPTMPMIMAKSSGSVSPPVTAIFLKKSDGSNSTSFAVLKRPLKNPFAARSSQGVLYLPPSGVPVPSSATSRKPHCWQKIWPSVISLPQCGQNTQPPYTGNPNNVLSARNGQAEANSIITLLNGLLLPFDRPEGLELILI